MPIENYSLTYYDEFGLQSHSHFTVNEYHNLMELLFDKYIEKWGDCKGRAWCGTCHIEILQGNLSEKLDEDEKRTLSKINRITNRSRLPVRFL
jgi:ferredoxin